MSEEFSVSGEMLSLGCYFYDRVCEELSELIIRFRQERPDISDEDFNDKVIEEFMPFMDYLVVEIDENRLTDLIYDE